MGNTFCERLKKTRKELGISQRLLSEMTGIHHNSLCRYENGTVEPTMIMAISIADALDVSLDWLAGRDAYCESMS